MPTLHDTTELTKNIIKWGGIGITAIIILVFLFRGSIVVYKSIFPDKPPAPEASFGKIPPIQFPESKITGNFTYVIDTVSGKLPAFSDRANVFETAVPVPNLLNLRDARIKLSSVSFSSNERRITDTVYTWTDRNNSSRVITYNIVSNDFNIISNYLADPFIRDQQGAPAAGIAVKEVTNFLEKLNLYPMDFDPTLTQTQYLTLQNNETFPATSISTGQITRVDLYRKSLNKHPIVHNNPPFSSYYFLIGRIDGRISILETQFNFQAITDKFSSYPLKSIEEAFDELKNNKAFIAAYYGTSKEILLKNIYLAYYIGDEKQQYIQPIFVFEGKNGFYAYVKAVRDTHLIESSN